MTLNFDDVADGFIRWAIALAVLLGSMPSSAAEMIVKLKPEMTAVIQESVKKKLNDPLSAQFGAMIGASTKTPHKLIVCGKVDPKNGLGDSDGDEDICLINEQGSHKPSCAS